MNIQKIVIDSFGKLENFTLELKDCFNLIYGENEAGKSTICAFLRAMFYGFTTKRGADLREDMRKRYFPWNGKAMSGSVYFSHEGREFMLERKFGQTKRGDKVVLRDGVTWQEVQDIDSDEIGKHFLGVGEDGFVKTLFIGQLSASVQKSGDDEVIKRLSNLKQSGDEDVSYQKILASLESSKHSIISVSGKVGAWVQLHKETDDLKQRLERTVSLNAKYRDDMVNRANLDSQIKEWNEAIKALMDKKGKAKAFEKYKDAQQIKTEIEGLKGRETAVKERINEQEGEILTLKEQLNDYTTVASMDKNIGIKLTQTDSENKVIEDKLKTAENIKKEIAELENQALDLHSTAEKGVNCNFVWMGIVIILLSIAGSLLSPMLLGLALGGIVLLYLAFKGQKGANETQKAIETLHIQIEEKRKQLHPEEEQNLAVALAEGREQISAILKAAEVSAISELVQKVQRYDQLRSKLSNLQEKKSLLEENLAQIVSDLQKQQDSLAQIGEIEEPLDFSLSVDEVDSLLEDANAKLKFCERAFHEADNALQNRLSGAEDADVLETQIAINEEKLEQLKGQYDALSKAIEVLEQSYETLKNDFAPLLGEQVKTILTWLTDGDYTDVKVSDEYKMMLMDSRVGEIVSGEYLSGGTYDLIYLALRLGIVRILFPDKAPLLVLDDTFLQLDDGRNRACCQYILEDSTLSQILYFTCHTAQVEQMTEENKNINVIKL